MSSGVQQNEFSDIDDYKRITRLGGGTFGDVFSATALKTKTVVAVKRIEKNKHNFHLREMHVMQRIQGNVNVMELLDVAQSKDGQLFYLIMPLMDHDLRGLIKSEYSQFFSQGQVKGFAHQVFLGIHHCHTRNIIHRDLKPENILVTARGVVKLADFGLARSDNPAAYGHYTNAVVTRWYRAPELWLGARDYTFAIDMWSAGCILGELLLNTVLLPAASDEMQLNTIWELCGTPLENGWPAAANYPDWVVPKVSVIRALRSKLGTNNTIALRKSFFTSSALDLLDSLLALDPAVRCKNALEHPYWTQSPAPHAAHLLMFNYGKSFFSTAGRPKKQHKPN